jgi:hypothetical protein
MNNGNVFALYLLLKLQLHKTAEGTQIKEEKKYVGTKRKKGSRQ